MIVNENKESESINIFELLQYFRPQDKSIIKLLPYKRMLKDGTLITNDDKFQAFFKVKTTDLYSISDDELSRIVNRFTYMNRIYLEPFKIYSLTYPTETNKQCLYWKHRISESKKALLHNKDEYKDRYLKWNLKLAYDNYEKVKLVKTLPELQFIIAIYGNSQKEINNHVEIMKEAAGRALEIKRLKGDDLLNVLKKLMNPNSNV